MGRTCKPVLRNILNTVSAIWIGVLVTNANAAETDFGVGAGAGQLGLIATPEEECLAPQAIYFSANGAPVILDPVNKRIVEGPNTTELVKIPEVVVKPIDFLITNNQTLILDGATNTIFQAKGGGGFAAHEIATETQVRRFVVDGQKVSLSLADDTIAETPITLEVGEKHVAGGREPLTFEKQSPNSARITIPAKNVSLDVESNYQIVGAESVSSRGDTFILVDELQISPFPQAFRRVLKVTQNGAIESEAYLQASANCAMNVDIAANDAGTVSQLYIEGSNGQFSGFALKTVILGDNASVGATPAEDLLDEVSAEEEQISRYLENYNGTISVENVAPSLSPITRTVILSRAKEAHAIKWTLGEKNYSYANIPDQCDPPGGDYWRRPLRLNGKQGQMIKSIPYRWGGYYKELVTFQKKLDLGLLAGDICTCREASYNYCIVDQTAGLDCSGFVSLSWSMPYLTTSSLSQYATIGWSDLRPADAVNKKGSHVRLVTGVRQSAQGVMIKVLESAVSCDGVCENEYSQHDLIAMGYKPIRRPNIQGE